MYRSNEENLDIEKKIIRSHNGGENDFVGDFMRLIPTAVNLNSIDVRESLSNLSTTLFKNISMNETKQNLMMIKEKYGDKYSQLAALFLHVLSKAEENQTTHVNKNKVDVGRIVKTNKESVKDSLDFEDKIFNDIYLSKSHKSLLPNENSFMATSLSTKNEFNKSSFVNFSLTDNKS